MLHFMLYNNMHFACTEAIECMNNDLSGTEHTNLE